MKPIVYALLEGGVPEWPKGSDCKSDAQASVVRIHLPPPGLSDKASLTAGLFHF